MPLEHTYGAGRLSHRLTQVAQTFQGIFNPGRLLFDSVMSPRQSHDLDLGYYSSTSNRGNFSSSFQRNRLEQGKTLYLA